MDAFNHDASERAGSAVAPSADDLRKLGGHPRFPQAMRLAAENVVDAYGGNRLLNQVLNDRGRLVLGFLALHLHFSRPAGAAAGQDPRHVPASHVPASQVPASQVPASQVPADQVGPRDGQLTTSRMMAICAETGICSPNRAAAMVALMRFSGYLVSAPGSRDRRTKVLVPTSRMIAVVQRQLACHFRGIALLLPEGRDALERLPDLAFVAALSRQLGDGFRAGWRVLDHMPELNVFAERNAGLVIAFSLLLARKSDDAFALGGPANISISALAQRFAVSRAHVSRLLRDAEHQGFIQRGGQQGEAVELLPPLTDAVQAFFARLFFYLARCARGALAELEASRSA